MGRIDRTQELAGSSPASFMKIYPPGGFDLQFERSLGLREER